ncbi:acyltransferase [Selenomonas sp. TAMA-11512]|uniref:acyltransferase n=1 Tax=Selenomonas sp. TAMA-11512 TaxID=3095337 RepID=UPI0030CD839F
MTKPRLPAIEYIRGISMLGVIGIHIGSQYLGSPVPNANLTALYEIVTRFAVPIFFFISAFGIFYNMDPQKPFSYRSFIRRRAKAVLLPYMVWSLFYLYHDSILYHTGFPAIPYLADLLFFGNAKYHLYFLVILFWFYISMPLWYQILRKINPIGLVILFFLQVGFNYFSSYDMDFIIWTYSLEDSFFKSLLLYRLNYLPLHYAFVFLIGGYAAMHIDEFLRILKDHQLTVSLFSFGSIIALLHYYYSLMDGGYTQMDAINTAHQLSPQGIVYTLAASFFFFMIFTYQHYPSCLNPIFSLLGRHSYFAYLVHPLFIGHYTLYLENHGIILTASKSVLLYVVVLLSSILAAILCRKFGSMVPYFNLCTIGTKK